MLDTETPASVVALRKAGPAAKPRLRGASHRLAALVSPVAAGLLVARAPNARAALAAAVYGVSLVALFAVSGLYHRTSWSPRTREWLGRVDHANIFLFVAGTYLPIGLLGVGGTLGVAIVTAVSAGALLGVGQTLFWPRAPRVLHIALYVLIGLPSLLGFAAERARLGDGAVLLQGLGALLYVTGAWIYSRRRPDPLPAVFGYHEVFHLLAIAGTGCFFAAVYRSVVLG